MALLLRFASPSEEHHYVYTNVSTKLQTTVSTLGGQAFSGFSLNAVLVAGDQPDSIAIVDSETGSMAVEINRQAVSTLFFPPLFYGTAR